MTYLAMVLLWLAAISGFAGTFSDGGWVVPLALASAIPLAVEWGASRMKAAHPSKGSLVRLGANLAHVFLFLTVTAWALYPDTVFLVFPTPATVSAFVQKGVSGLQLIQQSHSPLGSAPFLGIALVAVWWCAAASGAGMWSSGASLLAIAPPITIYVATRVIASDRPGGAPVALLVFAAGLAVITADYARNSSRWVRTLLAAGTAGACLMAGTLLAPALPGYGQGPMVDFRNPVGTRIPDNPLVDIRPRVVDLSAKPVFQVTARRAAYWRLTSLDSFDGQIWRAADDAPALPGPRDGVPAETLDQTIAIKDLDAKWIPAAAFGIRYPTDVHYDFAADSVELPGHTQNRETYDVISSVVEPTQADLRHVHLAEKKGDFAHYLSLPDNVPDTVRSWAKETAAGTTGPFDAALRLQDRLRTFTYDVTVDPGHASNQLENFLLHTKRGYCEQFSAAMAVAARVLGIPSRVAIGYIPGSETVDADGESTFEVRGNDAHAWPELYFEGYGWIAFEPTPTRGALQTTYLDSQNAPAQSGGTPSTTAPAVAAPTSLPSPPATAATAPAKHQDRSSLRSELALTTLVLIVCLLLVVALLPVTKLIRRRRRRSTGVAGAWLEARSFTTDIGLAPRPSETPIELAARGAEAGYLVERLARQYVTLTFAPDATPEAGYDGWAEESKARHEFAGHDRWKYILAMIRPASLVPVWLTSTRGRRPSGRRADLRSQAGAAPVAEPGLLQARAKGRPPNIPEPPMVIDLVKEEATMSANQGSSAAPQGQGAVHPVGSATREG